MKGFGIWFKIELSDSNNFHHKPDIAIYDEAS